MATDQCDASACIEAYQKSVQELSIARKTITVSLVGVILLSVVVLCFSASNFMKKGVPEFTTAFREGIAPVASQNIERIRLMAGNLYPVYADAFQKMFDQDLPKMEEEFHRQMEGLDKYAQGRWPLFQKDLNKIIYDQEAYITQQMRTLVGEKQAKEVAHMYRTSAVQKITEHLLIGLTDHQIVLDEIRENLDRIVFTEPDIVPPVNVQEAIGMLVELAGVNLQKEAELSHQEKTL